MNSYHQQLEQILTQVLTVSQRAASKYGPGEKDWMEKSEQFRQQEIDRALQAIDTLIREEIIQPDEPIEMSEFAIARNVLRNYQRQLLEDKETDHAAL